MKRIFPYLLILLSFVFTIFFFHKSALTYKFDPILVKDYLRSQDIEDPMGAILDRISMSDSDIYIATGYLYAKGESPTLHNFQHPPLMKYLFGFSTLMTENPLYVQMFFGFVFLILTYFLGTKIFKNIWLALLPTGLLLMDPVFSGMIEGAYLDLGQAVFALLFIILALFYPKKYALQGVTLGLFAASKFWSTAIIFVVLIYTFKILVKKEKIDYKKVIFSFAVAFLVFSTIYLKAFIDGRRAFNIFAFLGRDLKFMMSHNSAGNFGGPILLFLTGFFSPWWKSGVARALDWSILWPIGLICSTILAIKSKFKGAESLIYLLPAVYLLFISTGVPFTRYFLIILPFIYIGLTKLLFNRADSHK